MHKHITMLCIQNSNGYEFGALYGWLDRHKFKRVKKKIEEEKNK